MRLFRPGLMRISSLGGVVEFFLCRFLGLLASRACWSGLLYKLHPALGYTKPRGFVAVT